MIDDPVKLAEIYNNQKLSNKEKLELINCKSMTTVYKLLRKYNIPVKSTGSPTKYNANHNFFSSWSHDMAYCLGFITADGHVWKDKPYFCIGIHKNDKYILEYIRDCVSPNSKVKDSKKREIVQLFVSSQQIWKDLQKYNVTHQKTFKLDINFDIPEEYWGDYLRGFFDGDGSIYKTKMRGIDYYYSTFSCASEKMLIYIKNRLNMGIMRCLQGKYYELKFCQSDSLKLYDIIYKNKNCFKLIRKYEKFHEIHSNYKLWTEEENQILIDNLYKPTIELDKLLPNRSKTSIQTKKQKFQKIYASRKSS